MTASCLMLFGKSDYPRIIALLLVFPGNCSFFEEVLKYGHLLSLISMEITKHEIQKKSLFSEDATKKGREDISSDYSDAFSSSIARLSCRFCNYFTFNGGLIYSECTKTIQIGPKKSFINDITIGQDVVYNINIVKKVFLLF